MFLLSALIQVYGDVFYLDTRPCKLKSKVLAFLDGHFLLTESIPCIKLNLKLLSCTCISYSGHQHIMQKKK